MLTFDSGAQTVFGTPVDLAAAVGTMSYDGTAQVSLNGQATFGGILDTITDPMDVLPDATYTFDGTIFVSFVGGGVGGTFGINAFQPQPTPAGADVLVASGETSFSDSTQGVVRSFSGTIRYPNVTSGGTTSFVAFSEVPGEIPPGYELMPELSIFIDIFTSATFTGDADVCVTVADEDGDGIADGTTFPVAQLRLLHAQASGQDFTDVTSASSPDGFLCGNVSSLSPFVIGRDPSLSATTTTTTPGGGTTTTTLPGAGCTDPVACIDAALATPLCEGETINPKLRKAITAKLGKAKSLLTKAASKPSSKVAKLARRRASSSPLSAARPMPSSTRRRARSRPPVVTRFEASWRRSRPRWPRIPRPARAADVARGDPSEGARYPPTRACCTPGASGRRQTACFWLGPSLTRTIAMNFGTK